MKKALALLLAALMVCAMFAGCSQQNTTPETPSNTPSETPSNTPSETPTEGGEYIIKYPTHQIGSNSSAPANASMVETFNEKYKGQYKIEVEEVPGDQNYMDKMKTLIASKQMPAMVYADGLVDAAFAQGLVTDLKPYLEEDAEWAKNFTEIGLEFNTRDGVICAVPNEGQLIGYYYNKELFQKAGIEGPAKTWDEFWAICEKLKAAGITPMSMQTGDGGWVTNLWLANMIAAQDGGMEFMNGITKIDDFNVAPFIGGLNEVQKVFSNGYTTKDAIGGMYENAANNFISGNTAMMANGTWMIGSFTDPNMGGSEEFLAKVGIALYPNDVYISSPGVGFMVTGQGDKEVEAGIAMIKHWTSKETQEKNLEVCGLLPASPIAEIPESLGESNPLLYDILNQKANGKSIVTLGTRFYDNIDSEMSAQLALFAEGKCTAEDFASALTAAAAKN